MRLRGDHVATERTAPVMRSRTTGDPIGIDIPIHGSSRKRGTTMRDERVRILTEAALAVALAVVLNLWQIRLPINIAGGSVGLAMLPILVLALRRGPVAGMVAGALFGVVDFITNPYIVHWAQVVLDYPLPYMAVGLAGLGRTAYTKALERGAASAAVQVALWSTLGGLGRFVSHVVSGVVFFSEYAEGGNVWVYSIVYNVSYVLPSLVACAVLAGMLLPLLARAVPVRGAERS